MSGKRPPGNIPLTYLSLTTNTNPYVNLLFSSITETSTQQPSGFVQSIIAQLLLGDQVETVARFMSLSLKERQSFTGWSMDGWVRWLAGLRGSYERRMNRMCSIISESTHRTKVYNDPTEDWSYVISDHLARFKWPRGGMFIWIYVRLVNHDCFRKKGKKYTLTGEIMSTALVVHLTHEPYKVLVAPGTMFAANRSVRQQYGWCYFRLCFAAEAEENIDDSARRFAEGLQSFFDIKDVKRLERLYEEFDSMAGVGVNAACAGGGLMGC